MVRLALVGFPGFEHMARVATRFPDVEVIDASGSSSDELLVCEMVVLGDPLSGSIEAVERVAGICDGSGATFRLARERRCLPAVVAVKEAVVSGRLGALGLVRAHRWAPDVVRSAELLEEIDLAIWLFGGLPAEVFASGREIPGGAYAQVHLGFAGGGMALVDVAPLAAAGAGYNSLSAIGSSGAAYADDHHNAHLVFGSAGAGAVIAGTGDAGATNLLTSLVDSIGDDTRAASDLEEVRDLFRVARAVERSLETGQAAGRTEDGYELV